MIGAFRYCLSVFWFTLYHALRVIVRRVSRHPR